MCSMYWILDTTITCPSCGKTGEWWLQTHFMGQIDSCLNSYKIGQPVAELGNTTVTLNGDSDCFAGDCPHCFDLLRFGAEITAGAVVRVWPVGDPILPP